MMTEKHFKLTIGFNDPNLDKEELEQEAERLLGLLKEMDEVESVSRVYDPHLPEGSKSVGGFIVGLLTAEVSVENCKRLLGFLGDRLGGKPIELEVEVEGKKLKVTAYSKEELTVAVQAAQDFVATKVTSYD